ncbi:hypothetical protein Q4512_07115 [Oceanihabitans sp. 2_MG-2023]|uniref:hypothetical protein n=1 Tax=Oceanihabitans sp. 2_MG-2023 TaxID=3062661 RepID=UPI0026E25626|nr:hypothetical protein [Oceanihabitans sp. 2_MG-2023]MDO6596680.1 hypothetical protein [Oceanihabitans sp. 2_MG-2023]
MKEQMHIAAQYLSAAGISFLDKKDDDSHTNMGFNVSKASLESHLLSKNGDQLCLNYNDFSLQWKSKAKTVSFDLDGATHQDVLSWLTDTSKSHLDKAYTYNLHYDLPYSIDNSYIFQLESTEELKELIQLRTLAQLSLEQINTDFNKTASIRVWPHHFDTGIYTQLDDSAMSFGLGLAIPDNLSDVHYLYISGYKDGKAIEPSNFNALKNGTWINKDFKGAILPATQVSKKEAVLFFKEAINPFNR